MLESDSSSEPRRRMVECQLIRRGIEDKLVLAAFSKVPRHRFLPEEFLQEAYDDHPLPLASGQTISQPYMVALMTEALELAGDERVLEIGTGSGYQAAILAEIAKDVYSVERFKDLADQAKMILDELGYTDVKVKVGDGTLGWSEFAPYEAVIVTAGAPKVPQALVDQLKEGGRMVVPIGERVSQTLTLITKDKGKVTTQEICGCVFVPLVGREGWRINTKS